jgi:hypothetical protein
MNRPMPARDRSHRKAATGRTSRSARAVPGVVRLARGVTAHSAGRSQVTAVAPLLALVCISRRELLGNVKTYRTGKRVANNRMASGAGIATGAPQVAHVRAEGAPGSVGPPPETGPQSKNARRGRSRAGAGEGG